MTEAKRGDISDSKRPAFGRGASPNHAGVDPLRARSGTAPRFDACMVLRGPKPSKNHKVSNRGAWGAALSPRRDRLGCCRDRSRFRLGLLSGSPT